MYQATGDAVYKVGKTDVMILVTLTEFERAWGANNKLFGAGLMEARLTCADMVATGGIIDV